MEQIVVPQRRLGKLPPKFDKRTLRLASFVDLDTIAKPPVRHTLSKHVVAHPGFSAWGMMVNDLKGDCTCAGIGHARQVWTAYGSPILHTPSDESIIALYNEVNGGVDEGANMLDVLNKMLVSPTALENDTIIGFVAASAQNDRLTRLCHFLFGGVYVGVNLPQNAQDQKVWELKPGNGEEPGSWGGHAIWMVDYDAFGPTYITWGALQKASWEWHRRYCDEQYGVLDDDWLKVGRSPQGFRIRALKNAIDKLRHA